MRKMRLALIFAVVVMTSGSSRVFAAGYEKAVMLSGRYAGVANAVTSWVADSEALYFNPAGLAAARGVNVSLDFSPTFSQFKGPLFAPDEIVRSKESFSPVGGAFGSYTHGPLGLGAGVFVSGGTKAIYENVDPFPRGGKTDFLLRPTVQSDLTIVEFSAGAGYELREGLRVGAAYRIVHVAAKLGTAVLNSGPPETLTEIQLTNLSDTAFDGYRVGIQYAPPEFRWGFGAAFRSEAKFTAEGTSGGRILAVPPGGNPLPLTGGPAKVRNVFPLQVLFGVHYDISDSLRLAIDYDFTQYSRNTILDLEGHLTLPAAFGGTTFPLSDIPQNWQDLHNVRVGLEYASPSGWSWRGGYILTTKVPPRKYARATFSSPGLGHSLLLGMGKKLQGSPLRFDLAGEYSLASGTVTNEQLLTGKYSSQAFAAHLALMYSMPGR